jgi:hypothetical protein
MRSSKRPTLLASLWFALSAPFAAGSTVELHEIRVEVAPDGSYREAHRLRVRLDSIRDLERWSPFLVPLDENRELLRIEATVVDSGDRRTSAPRSARDRHEVPDAGSLHDSSVWETVALPIVESPKLAEVDWEIEVRPWFPAATIPLDLKDPTERLSVEVRAPGWPLRHRFSGVGPGSSDEPGLLRLDEANVPGEEPEEGHSALLSLAWSREGESWDVVGKWFRDVAQPMARKSVRAKEMAKKLVEGVATRRGRVDRLVQFVRQKIRYVAVEVGIGGFRPFSPDDVLERGWGDCKDKAFLLLALLEGAGFTGRPALVRVQDGRDIDPGFATPFVFNHAIVAVSEDSGTGFRFVDPTLSRGSSAWIGSHLQGRFALVVGPADCRLLEIPTVPSEEARELNGSFRMASSGSMAGKVRLALRGHCAARVLSELERLSASDGSGFLAKLIESNLPGATVSTPTLRSSEVEVPGVEISAEVRLADRVVRNGSGLSLLLPTGADLEERPVRRSSEEAFRVDPGTFRSTFRIELPAGPCSPLGANGERVNPAGSFRRSVRVEESALVVETQTIIERSVVDRSRSDDYQQLIVEEQKARDRRVRLRCGPSGESGS